MQKQLPPTNASIRFHRPLIYLFLVSALFSMGCTGAGEQQASSQHSDTGPKEAESSSVTTNDTPLTSGPDVSVTLCSYAQLQQVIAEKSGQIVIVDFWSTSCIPCMRELPHLVELAKEYPEKVACISFNLDYIGLKKKPAEKYVDKVQEFLQGIKADITNFLSTDTDEFVIGQLEAGALPAVAIHDQTGGLKTVFTDGNTGDDGLTYDGDVIPMIEELLSN